MQKGEIHILGEEQYTLFLNNYEFSTRSWEPEFIHQFRVAVKRIIALKMFLKSQMPEDGQKCLDELMGGIQPVYKSSGKVRNLQVLIGLLPSFKHMPPKSFVEYLLSRLEERKVQYAEMVKLQTPKTVLVFSRSFSACLNKFYVGDVGLFRDHIAQNAIRARRLIDNFLPGEEWHEARALFKRNFLLMQMGSTFYGDKYDWEEQSYYRELEQLLGKWHDLMMLGKIMGRFELTPDSIPSDWGNFSKEKTDAVSQLETNIRYVALSL